MGMTKKMKSYLISHSPPPSNLTYDVYSNAQHFSCAAALEYNGLKMVLTTDKINEPIVSKNSMCTLSVNGYS